MTKSKYQEHSKDELSTFKEEIDLVQFILDTNLGYQYKKGFQNKNHQTTHIVVENPDTAEHLIIHRNKQTGHFTYFNPENSLDKGTIIDFCSNKLSLNLGEIRKLLRPMVSRIKETTTPKVYPAAPLKEKVINEKYFGIEPLKTEYLRSRYLSEVVINNPLFYGTIGTKSVEYKPDHGPVKIFHNTAFLIKNIEGKTIGLSLKNRTYNQSSFKQNYSQSSTLGMWRSNVPETNKFKFGIVENPIDAMSHFQLHCDPLKEPSIMYFASNGTVRNSHFDYVQHFIDEYKPEEVLILADNDNAGLRFAVNYLGQLKHPADVNDIVRFYSDDVRIKCHFQKPINTLAIELYNASQLSNKDIVANINEFFKMKNEELSQRYDYKREEFKIESITQNNVLTEVKVSFDNRKELLLDAVQITQFLRPTNHLKLVLPVAKDFNKDLENITLQNQTKTQSYSGEIGPGFS